MSIHLTSGDVCEIAGIPLNTLDRWVTAGLLDPANSGRGHGRHRVYSIGEALAVAAGALYRREGADPGRVAGVVRLLASLGIERVEAEFDAGRTFPVPGALIGHAEIPGFMNEPPDPRTMSPGTAALMKRLDLVEVYAAVRRKVKALDRRPTRRTRGRKRATVAK